MGRKTCQHEKKWVEVEENGKDLYNILMYIIWLFSYTNIIQFQSLRTYLSYQSKPWLSLYSNEFILENCRWQTFCSGLVKNVSIVGKAAPVNRTYAQRVKGRNGEQTSCKARQHQCPPVAWVGCQSAGERRPSSRRPHKQQWLRAECAECAQAPEELEAKVLGHLGERSRRFHSGTWYGEEARDCDEDYQS